MQIAVGFDLVECDRFDHWLNFSSQRLERIFTVQEISYCRQSSLHASQRFAVRYAAREAFYKSLSPFKKTSGLPFFTICKIVSVEIGAEGATLRIAWEKLHDYYGIETIRAVSLSLTHTKTIAGATVVLVIDCGQHREK